MKVVLLLTGCVRPNVADAGVVIDTDVRKKQYVEAIEWYLSNTPYDVVFCENSGTDLSDCVKTENHGRVEFLTYNSDTNNRNRSKGYKEMEILEYIDRHSAKIADSDMLVKVTGRLVLLNIKELISLISLKVKVLSYTHRGGVNHKQGWVCAWKNSRRHPSDCKYIFFSKTFLRYLLDEKENIYNHNNFEAVTSDAITKARMDGLRFIYPPLPPREHGVSGGYGTSYDMNTLSYCRAVLKNMSRMVLFDIGVLPLKW